MFKLTVVAGPTVGAIYELREGRVTIGRQTDNTIVLTSGKISKRHCALRVESGRVQVEDLGSSNGTFVNGMLVKARELRSGDRLSVGEFVFQLSRKSIAAELPMAVGGGEVIPFPGSGEGNLHQVASGHTSKINSSSGLLAPGSNASLLQKVIWSGERYFLPFFYRMNLRYEWKWIAGGIFASFLLMNVLMSVAPLVEGNRDSALREAGRRATWMARDLADRNAAAIGSKSESQLEIGVVASEDSVRVAYLVDMDLRIMAPAQRLNEYLAKGQEAIVAQEASSLFEKGRESGLRRVMSGSTVVAVEPVKVLDARAGRNVIVAMAVVSLDGGLSTLGLGEIGVIYARAIVFGGLLALLMVYILYRLTVKPLEVLNEDVDKVLKGEIAHVTREFKFSEIQPLIEVVNSALHRIPKNLDMSGGMTGSSGPSGLMIEELVPAVSAMGSVSKSGYVLCDGERRVLYLNPVFQEVTGIRSEHSMGSDLVSVARDQGFGVFISDLMDRARGSGKSGLSEDYEFSGIPYSVHVVVLGGSDINGYLLVIARKEE